MTLGISVSSYSRGIWEQNKKSCQFVERGRRTIALEKNYWCLFGLFWKKLLDQVSIELSSECREYDLKVNIHINIRYEELIRAGKLQSCLRKLEGSWLQVFCGRVVGQMPCTGKNKLMEGNQLTYRLEILFFFQFF